MPAKKSSKAKKASKSKKGSSRKPSRTSARAVETGPVPPYGVAIREAIARGDAQEMRQLATSTRKWLDEVGEALNRLESSIK